MGAEVGVHMLPHTFLLGVWASLPRLVFGLAGAGAWQEVGAGAVPLTPSPSFAPGAGVSAPGMQCCPTEPGREVPTQVPCQAAAHGDRAWDVRPRSHLSKRTHQRNSSLSQQSRQFLSFFPILPPQG